MYGLNKLRSLLLYKLVIRYMCAYVCLCVYLYAPYQKIVRELVYNVCCFCACHPSFRLFWLSASFPSIVSSSIFKMGLQMPVPYPATPQLPRTHIRHSSDYTHFRFINIVWPRSIHTHSHSNTRPAAKYPIWNFTFNGHS